VGKFIPVEPEKWAEMVKAQAEVARLKAEVESLTSENKSLQIKATNLYNAIVIKCKVEEITHKANADSIISKGMMSEAMKMIEESVTIREQVERLTKAGDEMHEQATNTFQPHSLRLAMEAWKAAKNGVQP
jgi:hypothetical protein